MKRTTHTAGIRTRIGYLCGFVGILLLSGSAGAVVPIGVDTDAETGDGFGSVLAQGDFNGDGHDDMAVGLPYEDVNVGNTSVVNAGAVEVIYGSASGLTSINRQFLRQGFNGVEDVAEAEDNFGCSLAADDFNGDFFDDLAIGACREDLGDIIDAGAVHVIYGSPQGLSAAAVIPDQFWHQSLAYCAKRVTSGRGWTVLVPCVLGDMAEPGDGFGWALAAQSGLLVIGIPYEDVGSIPDAGAINVLHGSRPIDRTGEVLHEESWQLPFLHQDSPGIPDDAEPHDRFGYSLAVLDHILAIGIPWEDVGSIVDAGAVTVIYDFRSTVVSDSTTQFWHQNALGMFTDGLEAGDLFGLALALGNFNGWDVEATGVDLAIGVPREDVNGIRDAGAVNVIYSHGEYNSASRLTAADSQFWHQDSPNILDSAEPYDLFGYSLAVGDFDGEGRDDLAIGVPYEDIGSVGDAGAVAVIYGRISGLATEFSSTPNQFWHQNISNVDDAAEILDRFGFTLAAGQFHYGWEWGLAIGVPYEAVSGVAQAGAVSVIYGSYANSLFGGLSATVTPDQFWTQTPSQIIPPITF